MVKGKSGERSRERQWIGQDKGSERSRERQWACTWTCSEVACLDLIGSRAAVDQQIAVGGRGLGVLRSCHRAGWVSIFAIGMATERSATTRLEDSRLEADSARSRWTRRTARVSSMSVPANRTRK